MRARARTGEREGVRRSPRWGAARERSAGKARAGKHKEPMKKTRGSQRARRKGNTWTRSGHKKTIKPAKRRSTTRSARPVRVELLNKARRSRPYCLAPHSWAGRGGAGPESPRTTCVGDGESGSDVGGFGDHRIGDVLVAFTSSIRRLSMRFWIRSASARSSTTGPAGRCPSELFVHFQEMLSGVPGETLAAVPASVALDEPQLLLGEGFLSESWTHAWPKKVLTVGDM